MLVKNGDYMQVIETTEKTKISSETPMTQN